MPEDFRVSDEATGLPPLEEIGDDETLFVCAWAGGDGLVHFPEGDNIAVRYLHLRGLTSDPGEPPVWAQIHIAVPVEYCLDVAATLAKGTTETL